LLDWRVLPASELAQALQALLYLSFQLH